MGGSHLDMNAPMVPRKIEPMDIYNGLVSSLKSFDKTCKAKIELMKDIFSPEKQKKYTSQPHAVLKKVEMIEIELNKVMVEIGIIRAQSSLHPLSTAVGAVKSVIGWFKPDDAETSLKNNYSKLSLAIESLDETCKTFSKAMNEADPIILPIMPTQSVGYLINQETNMNTMNEVIIKVKFIQKEITDLIDVAVRFAKNDEHQAYLANARAARAAEAKAENALADANAAGFFNTAEYAQYNAYKAMRAKDEAEIAAEYAKRHA